MQAYNQLQFKYKSSRIRIRIYRAISNEKVFQMTLIRNTFNFFLSCYTYYIHIYMYIYIIQGCIHANLVFIHSLWKEVIVIGWQTEKT